VFVYLRGSNFFKEHAEYISEGKTCFGTALKNVYKNFGMFLS